MTTFTIHRLTCFTIHGLTWDIADGHSVAELGYIPSFLNVRDERPARDQLNENYAHGGGWREFTGFTFDPITKTITYPGDPTYKQIAQTELPNGEIVRVFPYAWVMIEQPNGDFEISRMD